MLLILIHKALKHEQYDFTGILHGEEFIYDTRFHF